MLIAVDLIKCPRCKLEKPTNQFNFKSYNGRSKWCRECESIYHKKYREKNAEKIKLSVESRKEKYNQTRKIKYHNNLEANRTQMKINYRKDIAGRLLTSAKTRARKKGLEFNITKEDIIIPKYCPVLGIELKINDEIAGHSSPSLDRIIPSKGYVKGNIVVVSYKANTIKNDATIEELRKVTEFYENIKGCD